MREHTAVAASSRSCCRADANGRVAALVSLPSTHSRLRAKCGLRSPQPWCQSAGVSRCGRVVGSSTAPTESFPTPAASMSTSPSRKPAARCNCEGVNTPGTSCGGDVHHSTSIQAQCS